MGEYWGMFIISQLNQASKEWILGLKDPWLEIYSEETIANSFKDLAYIIT